MTVAKDQARKIVLAEDDPLTARLIKKRLTRSGFRVEHFEDGRDAFERILQGSLDLALVDYQLPRMDGLCIIEALTEKGSMVPVVILSAMQDISIAVKAMKLGAVDYLVKGSDIGFLDFLPSTLDRVFKAVDQKRELQVKNARLRCLIDAIPDIIFFKGRDGKYQGCNHAAELFTGIPEQEIIGKEVNEVFPAEIAGWIAQRDELTWEAGECNREQSWVDREGGKALFDTMRTLYRSPEGEVLGLVGIGRDITAQKKMEMREARRVEELREANQLLTQKNEEILNRQKQMVLQEKLASLGTITTGIAHEIRNPLNFMQNMAHLSAELVDELLATEQGSANEEVKSLLDDLKQNLEIIYRHGKRVERVVESASKLTGSSASPRHEAQLNELVDEYVDLICGARISEGLTLRKDYDPKIGSLPLSAHDVGRVLINLMNNSWDAMQGYLQEPGSFKPKITVRTLLEQSQVVISIEDNGKGMDEECLKNAFNPFFTTKSAGEHNIGLGLSICYDIITEHGGEIELRSSLGEGTCCLIRLPNNPGAAEWEEPKP